MSGRRLDAPVVRLELELADGEILFGEWTLTTIADGPSLEWFQDPPSWLTDLSKRWDRPHDPVTYCAKVAAGHEDDARAVVE